MFGKDKDNVLAKAQTSMLSPAALTPVQLGDSGFDPKEIGKGPLSKAAQREIEQLCDKANVDAAKLDVAARLDVYRLVMEHNRQAAIDLLSHVAAQQRATLGQLDLQSQLNAAVTAGHLAGASLTAVKGVHPDLKDSTDQCIKTLLGNYLLQLTRK